MVGDGFICYNKTTCNSDCCGRGYRWSPLQGCIDIDECSLTPPPCGPGQLCENTPGSFSCLVSPVPQHHTAAITEPHSVVFACGNTQCPVGQDCLQVNGAARCTDPCQHYTPLRDAWRATDFKVDSASAVCDNRVWQGWYRLYIGNNGVQMPERCIEKYMCGTHAPLWLQTPHPQKSHGIIQGMVCGSWETGCCHFKSNPIHVKACPGNYYVYKFVSPNTCRLAYCAGKQQALLIWHYTVERSDLRPEPKTRTLIQRPSLLNTPVLSDILRFHIYDSGPVQNCLFHISLTQNGFIFTSFVQKLIVS